jgi:eukaryotic-like serine/threonine-protein kinase
VKRAQQLGRYHLLDRIAFGGMAEIYRARTFDNRGVPHLVAVKRVLAHLAEDDDFIQMLVDEAKIASVLRHVNIARVYEFARAGGEYFISMEHVDGKDMRTALERCRHKKKSIPPEHASYICAEIAAGLHAAHSAVDARHKPLRIIHRDVSPSNVIVSYSGEVKLCDFGIAKATLSRVHTRTGVIKGKVKYMSPEQALGRKLDHRSDIFSLGATLYEMLTRMPPFVASNEMDLLVKVRDAKYRPIRELEPEIPADLEAICDRCLTRSRANRYQTAAEAEADLRAFLAAYYPSYSRSHLGRFVRKMFATEIEKELRMLEEYVLDEVVSDDVGENLISGDAEFESDDVPFQPKPTSVSIALLSDEHERRRSGSDFGGDSSLTTLPQRPALSSPSGFEVHVAQTQILDGRSGRKSVSPHVINRFGADPAAHTIIREVINPDQPPSAGKPPAVKPIMANDEDDVHDAQTMIININRMRKR